MSTLQQFRIGAEDRGGLVVQHLLIRLQRAQQLVEARIARIGLRRRCAWTRRRPRPLIFFGLLVGHRQDLLLLPVGVGADAQRLLLAFGAVLPRDALALGPHARIDALLVLLRQVQPLDAHIHHLDAVLLQRRAVGERGQVVEHLARAWTLSGSVRHDRIQIVRAQRRREARPDDVVQPHLRRRGVAHRLHEAVRVLDLPGHVVLDDDVLLVARQELRGPRIVDAQPPVEVQSPSGRAT